MSVDDVMMQQPSANVTSVRVEYDGIRSFKQAVKKLSLMEDCKVSKSRVHVLVLLRYFALS